MTQQLGPISSLRGLGTYRCGQSLHDNETYLLQKSWSSIANMPSVRKLPDATYESWSSSSVLCHTASFAVVFLIAGPSRFSSFISNPCPLEPLGATLDVTHTLTGILQLDFVISDCLLRVNEPRGHSVLLLFHCFLCWHGQLSSRKGRLSSLSSEYDLPVFDPAGLLNFMARRPELLVILWLDEFTPCVDGVLRSLALMAARRID